MINKGNTYLWNLLLPIIIGSEVFLGFAFSSSRYILRIIFGNDLEFTASGQLWWYWPTLLVPVLMLFHAWRYNKRINAVDKSLQDKIFEPVSSLRFFFQYLCVRLAFFFLILTLGLPASGKKKTSGTKEALELVICIDVSNSMNVTDISEEKTRLDVTKRALNQLLNQIHGERIGLCIFANSAFVQLPVTRDYGAAKLFIGDIETDMISDQGTNIFAALETAEKMFSPERTAKSILVITDGENHEMDPSPVLKELKEKKVQVMIMGVGTTNGGLVPKDPYRPELGYKKNAMGAPVHSKLDKKFLGSLASKAGTDLIIADSEFPDLSELLTEINHIKRVKINNLEFEIKEERFQYTLMMSFVFWLLFLFIQFKYSSGR